MKKLTFILLTLMFLTSCEKENQLPSCSITYPNNGDEFEQLDTIVILVEANDNDGLIAEINFYIDDIGVFSSTSFPYTYTWNTSGETIGDHIIKVIAKDNEGGSQIDECTISIIDTVTDINGNIYKTVIIGNQVWMAENLKTTTYNDGTPIKLEDDSANWGNLTTGAYCWYDNDEATYGDIYGALYNWYTVETGNLCPNGWHVPTDAEWTALKDYLTNNGYDGTEGTALKATSGWNNDGNGTDDYGFIALPGGKRNSNGEFYLIGNNGYWWPSTEFSMTNTWYRLLYYNSSIVYRYTDGKETGFSVRCIKD